MDRTDNIVRRRHRAWFLASITSMLLAAGSVAFATSASAEPSSSGSSHSAWGHSHQPSNAHAQTSHAGHRAAGHRAAGHDAGGQSAVSLPRPNGFQAQADPDGAANGGVDQPGGLGGLDPTSQDGNNGSGNDADCEDDNRGVGVPGHCRDRIGTPDEETPETPPAGDSVVEVPDTSGTVALSPLVEAPSVAITRTFGTGAPSAVPTVLPNTGAGPALLALGMAGLTALAIGTGLLRWSRRSTA